MEEKTQGNPEPAQAEEAVFGPSSDDFFDALENDVNGAIQDDRQPSEVTPPQNSGPDQVTHAQSEEGSKNENTVDWEQRYKDSTREAQKLHQEITDLKPFIPVLDAMKNDSGLVDHVRNYLTNGGKPSATIQEQLGLDEDFVYDANEAMSDPSSDSAKLMKAHVDRQVQGRVSQMLNSEKQRAAKTQAEINRKQEEVAFREKHGMTDQEYEGFVSAAKEHILTLEDIHYLLNKDKTAANTANSTKKDMLNQMKTVRTMPTSASGANSQGSKEQSVEDSLFDSLKGVDGDLDNLFG
tara:strand:+ start:500 stop:1384 length:885 start_codon:yes stop_codon:yes gene_type:complete